MSHDHHAPILVVDDDEDIRVAVRDTLEDEGYTVALAAGGLEALQYLRSNPPPSLILLDWNMTPMNGPAFMVEFARSGSYGQVPVVLLTADPRAEKEALSPMYSGHLKKPVNLSALFASVARFAGA